MTPPTCPVCGSPVKGVRWRGLLAGGSPTDRTGTTEYTCTQDHTFTRPYASEEAQA